MKFKSQIFSQVSGSAAGSTFSHNKGGLYMRSRTIPVNPSTSAQTNVRDGFRVLIDAWSNLLTPAQRDDWNTYAFNTPVLGKLGDPIKLSGQNMYVRANTSRMQAGFARVDVAPTLFDLGSFTQVEITADASADTLSVAFTAGDEWAEEDGGHMLIYQSRPQNAARNFFKGPYQLVGSIDGEDPGPILSPAPFPSLFPLALGQRVFFKVNVCRADGRYTNPQLGSTIVVA